MALEPRCAAPEAVPTVAPWNELPQTITVLMQVCLRVGSRVEPMNLSGPGWRYHSPARGLIAGSMMSSGVALPSEPTRLYQTTMLCARASSCSRFRFGIAATQRGRAVQLPFIISRNRRAVVEGSTVTSFSSGGGGATAEFQSEMTSATDGDPNNATTSALAAAERRDGIMLSSLYLGGPRRVRPRAKIETSLHSGYTGGRLRVNSTASP